MVLGLLVHVMPSIFFSRIVRSDALVYNWYFFSEQPFYGNYSTLDSHTITVISHAFAYSSRWRRKPWQGLYLENPLCLSESIGRRVWDLQTLLSAWYRFHWILILWIIIFLVYNFLGGHVSIPQVTHAWHSGVSCCQCRRRGKSCQPKQLTLR